MEERFKEHNQLSLKAKLLLVTSTVMVVAIFIVSYIFYSKTYNQTAQLLQKKALAVAKSAAFLIDGDEFERISLSLNSEDPYYKEALENFTKLNENLGEGMLYAVTDGGGNKYTYIIDGSGTVEIGFKQQKGDFSDEVQQALREGESFTCEPYYVKTFDKHYISAFVPVFSSRNRVVGVIEYDYEGAELTEELRDVTRLIIVVAIMLITVVLGINYLILVKLFRPMNQLVESIGIIATGDLTTKLDIKRSDEIGRINLALNETVNRIHEILERIKLSSKKVTIASKSILVSSRDASEVYEELAIATTGISEVVQKQVDKEKDVQESIIVLKEESCSIKVHLDEMNKIISHMNNAFSKEQDDGQVSERAEAGQIYIRLNDKLNLVEQSMKQMDERISFISRDLEQVEEVSKTIDLSTSSLLAITQEQVATSEEFKAMAELLRQQAKLLDESISKFIV